MSQTADFILAYLAAGLVQAADNDFKYPYPPIWQQALNMLTVSQIRYAYPIPTTISQIVEMMETPLAEWWPGPPPETISPELMPVTTLVFGGQPDEWVYEFLETQNLDGIADTSYFQDEINQAGIRKILDLYRPEAETFGYAYVAVRRFLIENPVTTLAQIQQRLGALPLLRNKTVAEFYEPEEDFLDRASYQRQFWRCPHCGNILNWVEGAPRCARHSICGRLTADYRARTPVTPTGDLLRLKRSVAQRVCVPGLPEVQLYDWACEQQAKDTGLLDVTLWPGVDRYDLRLVFSDNTAWAIDVKDYADPTNLARQILGKSFYNMDPFRWDEGYYVFPQYRLEWNRSYVELFNRAASLPDSIVGLGMLEFRQRVQRKISMLSRREA